MKDSRYDEVAEVVKKAVTVGTTPSMGHDFFADYDARFTRLNRRCVPTGIPEFDKKEIFDGGLGAGELGVVVAPTGVGKSHLLVEFGANALKQGFNVLHYTLELSEVKVGVRYDSYLCDIDANDVLDRKDEIIKKYEKMKDLGRLIIKQYPMNVATIYTIRSHIERCRVRGFVPNVIMLDYADVMRSTRQFDSLRHELKLVYEELRGYADEIGIPLWTASQSNKEGSNNEIVDLGNMSEAYGKAMVADVVISISRRTFEKATGYGRLYIAKNRAGRDGLVYPVRINTARSRFEVTGNANMLEEANKDDETIMKTRIRSKLKSIAQDKAIDVKGKV
jgi:replicative DNA helicase